MSDSQVGCVFLRTSFIDFKDTEVRVSLSFPPVQTFLLEEMVACLGRHSLIVFRLWRGERGDRGDQIKPAAKAKETSTRAQPLAQDQTLSLGRILQLEQEVSRLSCMGEVRRVEEAAASGTESLGPETTSNEPDLLFC